MSEMEYNILMSIQGIRNDFLDGFFSTVTHFADSGIGWILIALVLCAFKKTRDTGIPMIISLAVGFIIGNLIMKNAFARTRPFDFYEFNSLLISKPKDYSFPSGHTLTSFEGAFSVFFSYKKSGTALIVLALMIAFSRLYLFVHYPTDVLAGMVLGIFIAFAVNRSYKTIKNKLADKKQIQ